jgi:pimeloyl-ACP methyl ester carboxylesterase
MKVFSRLIITILITSGFISGSIHAQSVDEIFNKFTKRYHTFQGTTLPYYIFVPAAYDPQIEYPLVLCLHGAGEVGDNPSAVKKNSMATVWARDSNQLRWPCFILVPQCPSGGWWTTPNIISTVNAIMDSLQTEFSIDTNRIYVTGLSIGGYGTWDLLVRFPNKFAAAVPVCGWGDPSKVALFKHIPIWNFHGALDATVTVTYSRAMMTALELEGKTVVYTQCHNGDCNGLPDSVLADTLMHGAKLLYTEYGSGGHSIWDQAYNNVFLLPWIFSQSKLNTPAGIEMEGYSSLPKKFSLSQNYPNPFNPSTTIEYQIPNVGTQNFVSLRVYDILGREVATLVNEQKPAGAYNVQWNAKDLTSGVYFYRLEAGSYNETKKLILLR